MQVEQVATFNRVAGGKGLALTPAEKHLRFLHRGVGALLIGDIQRWAQGKGNCNPPQKPIPDSNAAQAPIAAAKPMSPNIIAAIMNPTPYRNRERGLMRLRTGWLPIDHELHPGADVDPKISSGRWDGAVGRNP